eukprot:GHVT01005430.1.p1 GENE.GHVT01005430.1~~GHVT01005430.1.p1  ORF type:complete len:268 (-),score=17.84 GHVT01005430.1:208-1011(-)
MSVLLETNLGDIVIDLQTKTHPNSCTNFLKLCKIKYYNNTLIHSVDRDFVCKGGDPTNTGKAAGCSIWGILAGLQGASEGSEAGRFFDDELPPTTKHSRTGCVGMLPTLEKGNTNGSQFYITLRPRIDYLDGRFTMFGRVTEGLDIIEEKINKTLVDEQGHPLQNIRILHTAVLEDPFEDPDGLAQLIPPKSPEPIVDEVLKRFEKVEDELQVVDAISQKEAKARAVTLEILGDIPDADAKPPDNVLFVCKLNPVTEDGDLRLIFSR